MHVSGLNDGMKGEGARKCREGRAMFSLEKKFR